VADGRQGSAQLLLRLKQLLSPAAQDLERDPVSSRDGMQAAACEHADEDPDAESQNEERGQHSVNLLVPAGNPHGAMRFGVVDDVVNILTNLIHQGFSVEI